MSVVQATGVTKDYPRVRALDNLTLEIPGGAVGLLGPNGAGKSTLIKILLGFTSPSSGDVRLLNRSASEDPVRTRQEVGYMPENESFVPGLSAVDYVYLAARLTGLPHTDAMQRTHRMLNYVGLQEERYRKLETYSTGMKQKVKFAQAIVHHPRLLLLDEPTTGLDPRARQDMLDLIRDISRGKGINVVLSTHILPDVEAVCNHAVIMNRGRLVTQTDLAGLPESEEQFYEVKIKGDAGKFLSVLRDGGLEGSATSHGTLRVSTCDGTAPILAAAAGADVQVRQLLRARPSLEELFSKLVIEA